MIIRILRALIRWLVAIENLGVKTTLQIIRHRIMPNTKGREIVSNSKKFGRFVWDSKSDWVITHFYTPQIEIYGPTGNLDIGCIVDLGANIGTETLRFSKLYPLAKIISVEANKDNFERLKKNVSSNKKISPVHAAIWSSDVKLKLVSASTDSQAWHLVEVAHEGEFDMKGMTFEKILNDHSINHIDVLKIDIEGAERQLFDLSSDKWIANVSCFIIEVPDNDSPGTTQMIYRAFERNGINVNTYVNGENIVFVRAELDWKVRFIEFY